MRNPTPNSLTINFEQFLHPLNFMEFSGNFFSNKCVATNVLPNIDIRHKNSKIRLAKFSYLEAFLAVLSFRWQPLWVISVCPNGTVPSSAFEYEVG